jgi:hypothetical protein
MAIMHFNHGGAQPPVETRGRYITRLFRNPTEAAFYAADFHTGRRLLVQPSLAQAAAITGVDIQAVWWAEHREGHRAAIINGVIPLVPPHPRKTTIVPTTIIPAISGASADVIVDRLIAKFGVETVWRGIDRATAPIIAAE